MDQQLVRYQQNGVVCIPGMIANHWLEKLERGIAYNLENPTKRTIDYSRDEASGEHFFYDALSVDENPVYQKFVFQSGIAEQVARFMQSSSAVVSHVTVFVRSAGTQKNTPWHYDHGYWPYRGEQTCSSWFSLDLVPRASALEFVRGSHHWTDGFAMPDFKDAVDQNYLKNNDERRPAFPDIEASRADYDIVGWETRPGDCLLFHGGTAHGGSGSLPADIGRRSISIQWLGDDVTYQPKPGGADPDFSAEFNACGIHPGMSPVSAVCPVIWQNQDFTDPSSER